MDEKSKMPCPSVSLSILGSFSLRVGGREVSALNEHPSRLRGILCYLILHRDRAVTHAELIDAFCEGEERRDPDGALKMQIMRLRGVLRPLLGETLSPILARRGTYQWNGALACCVDAEMFEALCRRAEQPWRADEEKISAWKEAIALYRGEVCLEKEGGLWCRALAARLLAQYLSAVRKCTVLLSQSARSGEAEALCAAATEIEPMNEELAILRMELLLREKRYAEVRRQYRLIAGLLRRELGTLPSERLRQLDARCAEAMGTDERSFESVVASLRGEEKSGALFCSFEEFRSIYRLEVRRARRGEEKIPVAMLNISGPDGGPLAPSVHEGIMETVRVSVLDALRAGDVVARCGKRRFIILLSGDGRESGGTLSDLLMIAYRKAHPHSAVRLTCQVEETERAGEKERTLTRVEKAVKL